MASGDGLDDQISAFFQLNSAASRQECDSFALKHAGGQVKPVRRQGSSSYTVTAGPNDSKIFQFRVPASGFNANIMRLAKALHPQFAPSCVYHGAIGQPRPLHIYEMNNLPGVPYTPTHDLGDIPPAEAISRQLQPVQDMATFFAQAWVNRQRLNTTEMTGLFAEVRADFDLLAASLPPRFAPNLTRIQRDLPSLFCGALPFVLTHADLSAKNILIDPNRCNITGIIDWADAKILPFGFALWGLETILGHLESDAWHLYGSYRTLEFFFWRSFRKAVPTAESTELQLFRLARIAGLFHHFGFVVNNKNEKKVVDESHTTHLAYLDALCIEEDWPPIM
ncbi:hypothetical protein BGZ63DRAFT_377666 [Mariannaea sp. PMI_226]|nr:hypothetical protein BGZ63DRAFT_377666 [Mariannaea sp. PMI_226]